MIDNDPYEEEDLLTNKDTICDREPPFNLKNETEEAKIAASNKG